MGDSFLDRLGEMSLEYTRQQFVRWEKEEGAEISDMIYEQEALALAGEEGVPIVDTLTALAHHRDGPELFLDVVHLDVPGHRIVAEALYKMLVTEVLQDGVGQHRLVSRMRGTEE